ncbi:MAG: APC family permease [Candidatus Andeanibacterium colombiense]|uniref:APC family permease n=1 Tax=Candidatus Andeanibacterium colombiense TaxID=3121345 RepID=A0AAJ5X8A2_9SPHN|nr:MAG: APC family permease [Sphingomonadaceae bacterium]
MRAHHITFFVVAAAAPLGYAVGSVPLALGRGGIGTAGMFLLVGLFLALFAVGYVAMSRHIANAGALFSYVAAGLGRPLGLGTAFVAVLAYALAATGSIGAFAVFGMQAMHSLTGVASPWYVWGLGGTAAMGCLGLLNVDLNVKLLGFVMTIEVAVLLILSAGIVAGGGAQGLSLDALRPTAIAGGQTGVILMLTFAAFSGFEATALFREEARDPERTVRHAAFLSIAVIALIQSFVTWAIVQAFGSRTAEIANAQPTELFFIAARTFVGEWLADAMIVLVVTSWFASILAFHNATARYLHVLGRDGAIPQIFARRSAKTGAPWIGSIAHTGFSLVAIVCCIAWGLEPYLDFFVVGSVPVSVSIPAMECLTAVAILAFFLRDRRGHSIWVVLAAPLLSALSLGAVLYFVLDNIPFYTAREGAVNWIMPSLNLVVLAAGVARALHLRRTRPALYRRIGNWGQDSAVTPS